MSGRRRGPKLTVVASGSPGDGPGGGDPMPCAKCGEVHERCSGHRKTDGQPCTQHPVRGTRVCRMHSGTKPAVRRRGERRLAVQAAQREVARLGGSIDTDPLDAVLGLVREAAANVAVYRTLVADLESDVGEPEDETVAVGEQRIYSDRGTTHVAAAPHIFVSMYDAERDRLAKYAKLCIDAGIDERRVRLAEVQGRALAQVIEAALTAALDSVSGEVGDGFPAEALRGVVDRARQAAIGAADAALRAVDDVSPLSFGAV